MCVCVCGAGVGTIIETVFQASCTFKGEWGYIYHFVLQTIQTPLNTNLRMLKEFFFVQT